MFHPLAAGTLFYRVTTNGRARDVLAGRGAFYLCVRGNRYNVIAQPAVYASDAVAAEGPGRALRRGSLAGASPGGNRPVKCRRYPCPLRGGSTMKGLEIEAVYEN